MVLKKGIIMAVAVVATFAFATTSRAATLTLDQEVDLEGTGLGNVLTVLTIQDSPSESGAVAWNGSEDIITGDAKTGASQTLTRTVAELLAGGVSADSDFGLIFNVNEPGNDAGVLLEDLTATFYDADGSVLFTASTDSSVALGNNGGTGSSGWLFELDLTAEEREAFFGDTANRIGVSADVDNSRGAPESVFVASLGQPTIIPVPAAVWLGLAGLGMVMAGHRMTA